MGQPSIVEVDYHVLVGKLKQAADTGCLIERTDKDKWKAYVEENQIRETSLIAFGKVKFSRGAPVPVAIVMAGEWAGCYVYSDKDEAALKYVPAT
ncbi:hypothetical protein KJY73_09980 [Bowmanella sp. Y26]|uniref:Uncharacterized protein n=1 Tax=Bowmanella yangjiangensis TaxID=2811230 RepID=A0ABS3CX22_9ALTE|nr:hypothetical protein [Bowmanella yangjiangensis]MBN7821658.1 hypothetical protein [Bowmanella yangjiangensis]MBT1063902.1 hypothetical protein [Bowmanella yangjiangensis]